MATAGNEQYKNGYSVENFIDKLGGLTTDNTVINTYYNREIGLFKGFVENLFIDRFNHTYNHFLIQVLKKLLHNEDELVLSKKELRNIFKNGFKIYLEGKNEFDNELMSYYSDVIRLFVDKSSGQLKPIGEGIEITDQLRDFISMKGVLEFINYSIHPYFMSDRTKYTLSKWHEVIFFSLDEFLKVVDSALSKESKEEFHDFIEQLNGNEFVENFNFKLLTPA